MASATETTIAQMTDEQFLDQLRHVVSEHMGLDGYLRFLALFGPHRGDFTEERRTWNEAMSVDELLEEGRADNPIC